MRSLMFFLTLFVGIALAAVSFVFLASPLGLPIDESASNPRVPFAAGFFLIGVILTFIAPVVYELFPDKRD